MEFQHETGRIFARSDSGRLLAEVTFPEQDGVAVINHTFVDDSLRGQGGPDSCCRRWRTPCAGRDARPGPPAAMPCTGSKPTRNSGTCWHKAGRARLSGALLPLNQRSRQGNCRSVEVLGRSR